MKRSFSKSPTVGTKSNLQTVGIKYLLLKSVMVSLMEEERMEHGYQGWCQALGKLDRSSMFSGSIS